MAGPEKVLDVLIRFVDLVLGNIAVSDCLSAEERCLQGPDHSHWIPIRFTQPPKHGPCKLNVDQFSALLNDKICRRTHFKHISQ